MPIIYGARGDGHDLSKGAFDSQSVANPGTASLLLAEYMPQSFSDAFSQLSTNYESVVGQVKQSSASSTLWSDYVKPGLKQAGALVWESAKPIIMGAVGVSAGMNPTALAVIASMEELFSVYLTGMSEEHSTESQSVVYNKGQWLFIEKEKSLRRRMKGIVKLDPDADPKRVPKIVEFGFFISPSWNSPHKMKVFNMDAGVTQNVDVKAVRDAGPKISGMADGDESLSVIRELYFYKEAGAGYIDDHPKDDIYPGRSVVYKGDDYTLIQTNKDRSLIEDTAGKTLVVDKTTLKPGVGNSTAGKGGDFEKSNRHALYAGQWVMVPARNDVSSEFAVERELAVIFQIHKEGRIPVFFALDGSTEYVHELDIDVYDEDMQMLFSAKKPFKLFKMAAVEGDEQKAIRYELGSQFSRICLNDDAKTMEYLGRFDPSGDSPKKTRKQRENQLGKLGNEDKHRIDAQVETDKKHGKTGVFEHGGEFEEEEEVEYRESRGGGDGDDGAALLGIIAVGALVLIGFGGFAAMVPAIPALPI